MRCYFAIFRTKNTIVGLQVLRQQDNACMPVAGTQTAHAAGMLQPAAPVPLVSRGV
jgi:hypothetical protein